MKEYLYQRYDGKIMRHVKVDDITYLNEKELIRWNEKDSLLLDKTSKNITDLIEQGDFIDKEYVAKVTENYIEISDGTLYKKTELENKLKSILTHEEYEKNCFKM